jgi:hypothetical protein
MLALRARSADAIWQTSKWRVGIRMARAFGHYGLAFAVEMDLPGGKINPFLMVITGLMGQSAVIA